MFPSQTENLYKGKLLLELQRGELIGVWNDAKIKSIQIYSSRQIELVTELGVQTITAHNIDWRMLEALKSKEVQEVQQEAQEMQEVKNVLYFRLSQMSTFEYKLTMNGRIPGAGNGASSSKGLKSSSSVKTSPQIVEENNRIRPYMTALGVKNNVDKALHEAIFKEDGEAVLILLKRGANPNSIGYRQSNFVEAISFLKKYPHVIRAMVKAGADVNAVNGDGNSMLSEIVNNLTYSAPDRTYDLETVQLMLEKGANPNVKYNKEEFLLSRVLFIATWNDICYKLAKLLLNYGANPNIDDEVYGTLFHRIFSHFDKSAPKTTPELEVEAKEVVRLFIDKGVNFKFIDKHGQTSLSMCLDKKWIDIFMLLLEKGANPNQKMDVYGSLLGRAISYYKNFEATEALVYAGADVRVCKNEDGESIVPLIRVLRQGWANLIPLFLEKGAKVEDKEEYGFGCLETAVLYCPQAIDILVSAGASFDKKLGSQVIGELFIKNHWTKEAREQIDFRAKVALFKQYGVDINYPSQEDLTAIAYVISHYNDYVKKGFSLENILKELFILIECGADISLVSASLLLSLPNEIQKQLFQEIKDSTEKVEALTLKILTGIDTQANGRIKQLNKLDAMREILKNLVVRTHMAKFFGSGNDQTLLLQVSLVKELVSQLNQLLTNDLFVNVESQTFNQETLMNALQETVATWKAQQRQALLEKQK